MTLSAPTKLYFRCVEFCLSKLVIRVAGDLESRWINLVGESPGILLIGRGKMMFIVQVAWLLFIVVTMFEAISLIGAYWSKSTHSVMERGQCREEEPTRSDIKLVLALLDRSENNAQHRRGVREFHFWNWVGSLVVICMCRIGFLYYNLVFVWFCLLVPAKWLGGKVVSEVTYNESSGTLNPILPTYKVCQLATMMPQESVFWQTLCDKFWCVCISTCW